MADGHLASGSGTGRAAGQLRTRSWEKRRARGTVWKRRRRPLGLPEGRGGGRWLSFGNAQCSATLSWSWCPDAPLRKSKHSSVSWSIGDGFLGKWRGERREPRLRTVSDSGEWGKVCKRAV